MDRIPNEWQEILLDLQKIDPSVVLAGGAIRDLWCGRKPRDLDFFYHRINHSPLPLYLKRKDGFKPRQHDEYQLQTNQPYCVTASTVYTKRSKAWQYRPDIAHEINLVHITDSSHVRDKLVPPLTLVSGFDFGICQVAWDGKKFIHTDAFMHDWMHGVFTLMFGNRHEQSRARYDRINQRYNWPMKMSGKAWLDITLEKLNEAGKPKKTGWTYF